MKTTRSGTERAVEEDGQPAGPNRDANDASGMPRLRYFYRTIGKRAQDVSTLPSC